MNNTASLWRQTGVNTLVSTGLFIVFFLLLWAAESLFPQLSLLHFDDMAWCIGIPASVIGVAYVLTIRNPENHTGFYPGILMSLLLGLQCFMLGNYDLTVLYVLVFVPFQIKSILSWTGSRQTETDVTKQEDSKPAFLSRKARMLSLLVFLLLVIADYLVITYFFQKDTLFTAMAIKLLCGIMLASSVLSNFWLIYRKTDSWIYWVIYSLTGILFFIVLHNAFSVLLFCFFLVINSMAGIAWLRMSR